MHAHAQPHEAHHRARDRQRDRHQPRGPQQPPPRHVARGQRVPAEEQRGAQHDLEEGALLAAVHEQRDPQAQQQVGRHVEQEAEGGQRQRGGVLQARRHLAAVAAVALPGVGRHPQQVGRAAEARGGRGVGGLEGLQRRAHLARQAQAGSGVGRRFGPAAGEVGHLLDAGRPGRVGHVQGEVAQPQLDLRREGAHRLVRIVGVLGEVGRGVDRRPEGDGAVAEEAVHVGEVQPRGHDLHTQPVIVPGLRLEHDAGRAGAHLPHLPLGVALPLGEHADHAVLLEQVGAASERLQVRRRPRRRAARGRPLALAEDGQHARRAQEAADHRVAVEQRPLGHEVQLPVRARAERQRVDDVVGVVGRDHDRPAGRQVLALHRRDAAVEDAQRQGRDDAGRLVRPGRRPRGPVALRRGGTHDGRLARRAPLDDGDRGAGRRAGRSRRLTVSPYRVIKLTVGGGRGR